MKRILLIENHAVMRHSLIRLIQTEGDLEVCAAVAGGKEGMRVIKEIRPDLAILGLSLRDRRGLDVIGDLRGRDPAVKIVVVSMRDESLYAERALRAGASGYLMKEALLDALIPALRWILAGGIYLSERMIQARPELLLPDRGQIPSPLGEGPTGGTA